MVFSLRIVTTDHYMSAPIEGLDVCYNEYRGCDVIKVPVIRIYGVTPAGQKSCVHVHGVFPYLYILYDGTEPVDRYLRLLTSSIDKALNIALGRASSNSQHVYKVSLVSGITFYGFHDEEQVFVKIYLYNPLMIKKVSDLLLGGAIMNKVFQPYESHIPYQLQMFIDYNLYGMNMLNAAAVKFRRPLFSGSDTSGQHFDFHEKHSESNRSPTAISDVLFENTITTHKVWDLENIPIEMWLDASVKRQSTCMLEVDVVAADILNRLEVGASIGTNPGLAAIWEDERQRRQEKGDLSSITPPDSPERCDIKWTSAEAQLQNQLEEALQNLELFVSDTEDSVTSIKSAISEKNHPTPSSEVELHLSRQVSELSTSLVMSEEDEDAVVDEQSIHQIVMSSQSFTADRNLNVDDSQREAALDNSLIQLLASLANSESPTVTHGDNLEDHDALLSQHTVDGNDQEEQDREELEMSQRFIPDVVVDDSNQQCESSEHTRNPALDVDLQGMDQSWNNSQWLDVPEAQSSKKAKPAVDVTSSDGEWDDDDDYIPQLDGPIDVKGARHQGLTESSRKIQEQRDSQAPAMKAETFSYSSKKGGHLEKEYINGGVSTGTKLDLRCATSPFVKVTSSSVTATSISPKKSFQVSSSLYKPKSTVIDLSNMMVSPVKQTVSLLGAKPVVKDITKSQAAESKGDGDGDERSTAADPELKMPEKSNYEKSRRNISDASEAMTRTPVQQNNSSHNAHSKSQALVIRPGQLVPEKTCRSRRMRLPVVPESCKIDLRSIMSPRLPPRPTASTKAKMKDWAAAMTSMDRHVYSSGTVRAPVRPPNSRTMYSPVDSMMEQVVPAKSLKTYIPPAGIRTSKQNSTMSPFKDPGMIVDAALKAEGKENTKKPANRIYRKHVSGIIPKEDPREKKIFRQQSLSDLPAHDKLVDRSLTDSEQCRQSKQLTAGSDVKHDIASDIHGSKDMQRRELKHGQHSKYTTEEIQDDTENGEIRLSKGGEKRYRKQRQRPSSEDGEAILETNSSPERNNIFSVVTLEVPGANSCKKSKSSRHSEQQKKALDEKSAAKIVKGLLGFKKNLLSGKSQEELKKIQEKLSGMPGSKNAPVILDDEDIGEGFSSGNVMTEDDYSMQLKIRKRRRRRRLSSRSNKSLHTTGSEKDISDPDDYIIRGRRDSDSSADSDASLDLKTHVGAHQKTYEKPSYRVGDSFGKKPDSTFDKVVSKTSDSISRKYSATDSENDTKPAMASLRTSDQKLAGLKHVTSKLSQPLRRKYAKSRSSDNDEEKQHSWLMLDKKSHLRIGESRFSGLVRKPSKIPRRKPLIPGRIRITSTSPLRYCQGRRRSLILSDPDFELPEECCTVQVLKDEYDEYISELLGKECVILAKMTDKEVEELKKQVKREMEHKRTEHIMPLVMQKTREEIEKEYEEVKRRVLEEMAKEPPMPDYVDSDEEFLDSDSEKSGSEGVTEMNTNAKPVTEHQKATTPKLITDGKDDPSAVAAREEMVPVLEQAVGITEPVADSQLLADNLTVITEGCNPSGEVFGEAIEENVTFVIMSQEEAESEGVLVTEQTDLPQPIMTVDFDSTSQQIIDVGQTANGKGLVNVSEEAWNEACPQDSMVDDQAKDAAKTEENKILQRDTEMMKSVEAKPGRSSLDMPNDKGEMTEVDFSLLEMDTDNEAHDGSLQDRDLDTHKQLHTPPIMIDSDQSEDNEILVTPKQEIESQIVDGSVLGMPVLAQEESTAEGGKGSSLFTVPVELADTNSTDEKTSKKRKISEQGGNIQIKIKLARTTASDKEESILCTQNEGTSSPRAVISDMRSEEGSKKQSTSNGNLKFHLKPCFVKLKRLVISGTSVIVSDDQNKGKWPLGSGIGGRYASYTQSIMTDVVTENSVDPLWEAHKQRLAVMTQPSRPQTARRQKGPPRHLADYVIPDGTLPTAPKKPSPRKKIRDPFVRSSSGRRAKKRTEQRKFLDKLSILHQYTLDSLSTASETGDGHTSGQSEEAGSGCSNVASATASPVTNVPKPVAVSYANDARDDHSSNYDDVMYKLALLSPEEQAVQDKSMPQPMSPTQGETASVPAALDLNDTPRHESAGSAVFVTEKSLSAHTTQQEASAGKSSSSTKPSTKSQENQVKEVGVPYTVKTEVVRIGSGSQPSPPSERQSGRTDMGQPTLEQSPSGISRDRAMTIMEMETGTESESREQAPYTENSSHVKQELSAGIDTGRDEQLDSLRSTAVSDGRPSSQELGDGSGSEDRSTGLTYPDERMSEGLKSLETERSVSADGSQQMMCDVSPAALCTDLLEARQEGEKDAEEPPTNYKDVSPPPVTLSTQPVSPCSLDAHRPSELPGQPCDTASVQPSDRQQAPCHPVTKEQSTPDGIQPPILSTDQQLHDQAQEISVPASQDCSASEELPSHISQQPSSLSSLYYSSSHSQTSQVPLHSATPQSPCCSPKQQQQQRSPAPSPKPKTPPRSPEHHSLPPSHAGRLPVNSAIPLSATEEQQRPFRFPLHSSTNQSPPRSPLPQSPSHSSAAQASSQSPASQTFTRHQPPSPHSPHSPSPSASIRSPSQTTAQSPASSPRSVPRSTAAATATAVRRRSPSHSPSHAAHSPLPIHKSRSPPHSPPAHSPGQQQHQQQQQQPTPLSPCPRSPQPISPPRSPSPIRSPDPHRPAHHGRHDSHMPAVIPLNIEDPVIQEEVEKARRMTLMKLLGHSPPKLADRHQWPGDPEAPAGGPEEEEAVGATVGQSGDGPQPEARRTDGRTEPAERRASGGPSMPPSGSGRSAGDGEQLPRRLPLADGASDRRLVVQPLQPPPSREAVVQTAQRHALGQCQADEVYCSNPEDVPDRPR